MKTVSQVADRVGGVGDYTPRRLLTPAQLAHERALTAERQRRARVEQPERAHQRDRLAYQRRKARDPEAIRLTRIKTTAKRQTKVREWLQGIKLSSGCMDCGYREHVEALDFDHRDGATKAFNLGAGTAPSHSYAAIAAEVEKCDVVCANCHRVRTAARRTEASGE